MSRLPKASAHMQNPSVQQNNLANTAILNQNNPNIMGRTVLNTVYQNPSQMPNQAINSAAPLQRRKSNSFNKYQDVNNNINSQIGTNNPIQNNVAKTVVRTANTPNRLSAVETSNITKTQIPTQSRFKNTTINDGKQINNQNNKLPTVSQQIRADLNTQQSINDQKLYSTIHLNQNQNQSIQNTNKLSSQLNRQSQQVSNNQSIQQNKLANTTVNNTQIMGQTVLNTVYSNQNTNVNSINAHSQLNNTIINPNIGSRAPIHNSHASAHNAHNQNQNASIQNHQSKIPSSSTHQSNLPVQQGSQVRGSHKEEAQKQSNNSHLESSLMRKSSLKASRNKSPPQVIKTPDGKIKSAEKDSNGNSYSIAVTTDNEAPDICLNLNKYLENEIKHSQLKETKTEAPKKGNGFRYFGQLTKAGRNQNGQRKTNQDTPLVHLSVGGIPGFNLFGVLDGHGPHGHYVSQFCKDHFIKYMTNYAEACIQKKIKTPESIYAELKNNKFSYIIETFKKADVEMSKQNQFDYNFSGTTCNIVFQFNKYLVCSSVGDSRGILVEDRGDSKNLGIVELSHDHKPDLPEELNRINLSGGIVEKITDSFGEKVGPPRVWKAGANYPGLAMSRSLGDFQAKQCGVIAIPDIIEYTISRNSRYLLVCSDGVWEFIKNEQVRDLGNVYFNKNDVGGFCTDLVKFAVHSWEQFDIIRDDITVVSAFF